MARAAVRARGQALTPARFGTLSGLFFVSGAAGLVDQVCFSKYLSYFVGATAYAVSAVLAAFMTGLAVGAALGGKLSNRTRRPLAAYGVAELCAAVSVALAPSAFAALTPLYLHAVRTLHGSLALVNAIRWALSFVAVAVPTTAMGATLPLVAPALAVHGDGANRVRKRRLGILYALNTCGGALGALAGAYVFLPRAGLAHTLYGAAFASALAGLGALAMAKPSTGDAAAETIETALAPPAEDRTGEVRWLGLFSVASGFLVFTLEVVTTHLLAVIIGNSAYAFGLILAAFLTWLFVGAALAPRLAARFGGDALGLCLGAQALALSVTLPWWDRLPLAFAGLGEYVTSFEGREAMRGLVAFGILALPVTTMGLTFPLVLNQAAGRPDVGRLVGRFAAQNTVGAVAGALSAGYFLLPRLGSERAILAVSIALAGLACAAALRSPRRKIPLALSAASIAIGVGAPSWNIARLTAGTNVYFDSLKVPEALLHVREDVQGGITTVTIRDGVHTLCTNGKFQGNDGWELNAQRYFAHYPSLFVENFDRALVIGFGTGTTLGTLATYPWRELDVVELSPAIVEASRMYFAASNGRVLDDPRVHVTFDDARNYLTVHGGRYHLISMELSSVWFAGASSLYSREYYDLIRSHLEDDGVFQQWVQLHHVSRPVFAALVNTLRSRFEHVALFYGGGQGILVSSKRPLRWSHSRSEALERDPEIAETLPNGRPLTVLSHDILALDSGLDRFLQDSASKVGSTRDELVSTDDNLLVEYETPRGNVMPWSAREYLVAILREYSDAEAITALEEDAARDARDGRDKRDKRDGYDGLEEGSGLGRAGP